MFYPILNYEIKTWLRSYGFYLLISAFFLIPLFLFMGTAGYFDESVPQDTAKQQILNSPFQINAFLQFIGKFLLFVVATIFGTVFYRDFKEGAFKLLYSYPIQKRTYLGAKFTSAFLLVFLIALMPAMAFLTGECLLGTDHPHISETNLNGYFFSYFTVLIPNLLFFGSVVSTVVVLFRNIYAGFIVALLFIGFQFISENLFHQSGILHALFDPLGEYASQKQGFFWTLTEKNTRSLEVGSLLIYNRLLWVCTGIFISLLTFRFFKFQQFGLIFSFKDRRKKSGPKKVKRAEAGNSSFELSLASDIRQNLLHLYTLVHHQLRYLFRHWIFWTFTVMGIVVLVIILNRVTQSDQVVMLPLTRLILGVPAFFYTMLVTLASFIFAGMLTLRAKSADMESLIHSTTVPTAILVCSKGVSLAIVQFLLLFILMLTGIIVQLLNGYYHIDLAQYACNLFLVQAPVLIIWSLLSVVVFSISRHLYLGLFILLMVWLAQFGYDMLGISSRLYQFNTFSILDYSDFQGYDPVSNGRWILQVYWLLWTLILLYIAHLFWPRRLWNTPGEFWRIRRKGQVKGPAIFVISLLIALTFLSIKIYKAENEVFNVDQSQNVLKEFKSRFSHFENFPQPRITSVNLNLDLFPDRSAFLVSGEYYLINKTDNPIDSLLVKTSIDEITAYQLGIENRKIDSFPELNFYVHKLIPPLASGDSLRLNFTVQNRRNSLFQKNSSVIDNGTYLRQDILPHIGYFLNLDKKDPTDSNLPTNHYQSYDSDLVDYRATISTSYDQTALTNGYLVENWKKEGRNYFSYRTPEPVKFNFHFNSGNFDIYKDQWKETPVNIYHHPDHTHNLEAIATGVKEALEFNSRQFGFEWEGEISVIEYPLTEGSSSTLKSSAIIMSETLFGVNTERTDKINLPFYVAAHEMTHHWFGNQLLPKDVKGATFLTESITEYLSLQIFKNQFGEKAGRNFLKVQHNRYFRGRARERKTENPLYLVEPGQEYIAYGKGAMALNAIAHEIGEEKFLKILSDFLMENKQADHYPTSLEFINFLKSRSPNRVHALIDEWLTGLMIYDHKITSAKMVPGQDGGRSIEIQYNIEPVMGEPKTAVNPRKWIDLAIYDSEENLVELVPLPTDRTQVTIEVKDNFQWSTIILDPDYLTLDVDRKNNFFKLR